MKQVQEALKDIGIPVMAGVWRATSPNQNPPTQYAAVSYTHLDVYKRQVLESLIRVQEPEADVPLPAGGRWLPAGEIMGNGYALAWRILDAAQGWGVAQRRKRVFAVHDFAGGRAGEVLFESEGLSLSLIHI